MKPMFSSYQHTSLTRLLVIVLVVFNVLKRGVRALQTRSARITHISPFHRGQCRRSVSHGWCTTAVMAAKGFGGGNQNSASLSNRDNLQQQGSTKKRMSSIDDKPPGFSVISSSGRKTKEGAMNNKGIVLNTMEDEIQRAIDQTPGLRDVMNLQEELREIEQLERIAKKGTTGGSLTSSSSDIVDQKKDRLAMLRESGGWTEKRVHNILHEITWDSSAAFRDGRHRDVAISFDMETHMRAVAKWALAVGENSANVIGCSGSGAHVCDVGCGNGILLRYVREVSEGKFAEEYFSGIDLSKKMLDIAASAYPKATFIHKDFLDFNGDEVSSRGKFSSIVFNECLHNFLDIREALLHANSLLRDGGRVVISHPKGFDNVFLQRSKNRLLVPSLLPTSDELSEIAKELRMDVEVVPKIKSTKYLAVLSKGESSVNSI